MSLGHPQMPHSCPLQRMKAVYKTCCSWEKVAHRLLQMFVHWGLGNFVALETLSNMEVQIIRVIKFYALEYKRIASEICPLYHIPRKHIIRPEERENRRSQTEKWDGQSSRSQDAKPFASTELWFLEWEIIFGNTQHWIPLGNKFIVSQITP